MPNLVRKPFRPGKAGLVDVFERLLARYGAQHWWPGESPFECARRELYEETGLQARSLHFRGLVTEISPRPDWQWMLFLYVATDFSGELIGDEREGSLRWWSLSEVSQLPIPEADKIFFPKVVDLRHPFYQAKYIYDADLKLVKTIDEPA